MLSRKLVCLHLWMLVSFSVFSQVKTFQAVKTTTPPKIDGVLDDSAWHNATVATDFIQNYPHYGQPASQRTEVKALYDNTAIYIAAHLYDDPALIRKQITARDEEQAKDLDFFSVFFDTYNDHQNGFQFLVTSSNVQSDARLSPGFNVGLGDYGDKTWDAVWDSKVSFGKDGWMVEMKIPYLSLRFAASPVQHWGMQLMRSVRRNNETTFWNSVNPEVNGFVNQFGVLENIVDVKPPLRLSFSPYLSTGVRSTPEADGFRTEWLRSGGMDVKYGINESFTLDATLIPDFGQVISDNVVNNLTPYEVRFDEYRPFFTEGIDIFNKSGLFYSRRVGAIPTGYDSVESLPSSNPNVEVVKNSARTQLYNAIKFSGRTANKTGIGIFNAIAAPMYATIKNKTTEVKQKVQTELLANYNIVVIDQALKGRSYVTFTNTNVLRDGKGRDANVTGLDVSLYDRANNFNVKAFGHYSKIFESDPYDGLNTLLRLGKISGKVRFFVQNNISSPEYDPTDLGYLQTPNLNVTNGAISYNQFTPTKSFISYTYSLGAVYRRLFRPDNFSDLTLEATGSWVFRNFWDVSLSASYLPDQHDYFVTGKPYDQYARRPQYGFLRLNGNSDSRKRLFFHYDFLVSDFFKNPEKEYYLLASGIRYRFGDKFSMELSESYEAETDYITPAGRDAAGRARVNFVDFKEVSSILASIYNFTPRINLTLRVRHYWSNVSVNRLVYLDDEGNPDKARPVPFTPYTDNINYFNADAFFTWDFRYGSRLIIGYKNSMGDDQVVDPDRYTKYFSNLAQTFNLKHGNELTVRFIYFLDYSQLKYQR